MGRRGNKEEGPAVEVQYRRQRLITGPDGLPDLEDLGPAVPPLPHSLGQSDAEEERRRAGGSSYSVYISYDPHK